MVFKDQFGGIAIGDLDAIRLDRIHVLRVEAYNNAQHS
jgi:hypothetical protein